MSRFQLEFVVIFAFSSVHSLFMLLLFIVLSCRFFIVWIFFSLLLSFKIYVKLNRDQQKKIKVFVLKINAMIFFLLNKKYIFFYTQHRLDEKWKRIFIIMIEKSWVDFCSEFAYIDRFIEIMRLSEWWLKMSMQP